MSVIRCDGRKKTRINERYVFNWHRVPGGIRGQVANEYEGVEYSVPREIEKMIVYPTDEIDQAVFTAKMRHDLL